jgi:NAD(P)-dependent dehydrogenase (short-subunit alcohol dehydrogenase family)
VDLGLAGRVVLITGGRRGIGFAIAEVLIEEGARVAICGRDEALGEAAAARLGAGAASFAADVRRDDEVRQLVEGVVERFGRLDAVVNNAGRFGGGPVQELTDERVEEGTDTKVVGALRVVRHALPHLRASDQARIVNISGISAESVIPGAAVTAIGNSGLLAFTAYLADELVGTEITVNAVIPGYILTEVWRERAEALAEAEQRPFDETLQVILDRQRMRGRWGTAREVGEVVAFLLSRQAGFVSGATLRVDGGQFAAVTY